MGTLTIFLGIGKKGVILGGLREKERCAYYVYPGFGLWMKIFSKFHDKVKSFNEWDSCQKSLNLSSAAYLSGWSWKSHFMLFESK